MPADGPDETPLCLTIRLISRSGHEPRWLNNVADPAQDGWKACRLLSLSASRLVAPPHRAHGGSAERLRSDDLELRSWWAVDGRRFLRPAVRRDGMFRFLRRWPCYVQQFRDRGRAHHGPPVRRRISRPPERRNRAPPQSLSPGQRCRSRDQQQRTLLRMGARMPRSWPRFGLLGISVLALLGSYIVGHGAAVMA